MNTGAPTSAVTAPTGISAAVALRQSVSTTVKNAAPSSADAGNRRRWSGPKSMRARCGITRPTHAISPATATTAAEPDAGDGGPDGAEDDHAVPCDGDPERSCFVLPTGQNVQSEGECDEHEDAKHHWPDRQPQLRHVGGCKAAHQPEHQRGQLPLRVREVLQQGGQGGEQGRYDNPSEHQHQHRRVTNDTAEPEHQHHGRQPADEGGAGDAEWAPGQKEADASPEPRAGQHAHVLRADQRVPQTTL